MPNVVRNRIFTEYAMETSKDSIKYMKPVFSKTQNGKDLNNRATDPDANGGDPWGYDDPNLRDDNAYDNNAAKLHKALYESTEDRYVQEIANASVEGGADGSSDDGEGKVTLGASVTFKFDANNFATLQPNGTDKVYNKMIEGYSVVYFGDETNPVAVQDKVSKKFAIISDWNGIVSDPVYTPAAGATPASLALTIKAPAADSDAAKFFDEAVDALKKKGITPQFRAYARYDSEDDFVGDYLGEVQLKMWDYKFEPRPTTIGVTWSQLSELVLDTSFSVNVETELVTYAAQEIRVALDYKAIRLAYQAALTNDAAYTVHFQAGVNATDGGVNAFGYKQNAQTFASAVARIEDTMLNDMNRGGVSRLVGGPAAASYCYLLDSYTSTGAEPNIGAHQVGEILNGIPLFKVPSSIIPNNRMLSVYKNDQNEADVSIVFGTLIPFYSTGTIVRKNFYKEAGIASYGDWALLNKRYLGIIQIDGIKDAAQN